MDVQKCPAVLDPKPEIIIMNHSVPSTCNINNVSSSRGALSNILLLMLKKKKEGSYLR